MNYPLELTVHRSLFPEYILYPAGIWQYWRTSSHSFNELYIAHLHEPFALNLIHLSHHRVVKTNVYVPLLNLVPCYPYPLKQGFKLCQTHKWFVSWLHLQLRVFLIQLRKYWPIFLNQHVILLNKVFLFSPCLILKKLIRVKWANMFLEYWLYTSQNWISEPILLVFLLS